MGREGFGYDINRHTAIRFCRLSKPGHLGGLLCLTQRRRLKLLTNPTLRISGIVQLRCRRFPCRSHHKPLTRHTVPQSSPSSCSPLCSLSNPIHSIGAIPIPALIPPTLTTADAQSTAPGNKPRNSKWMKAALNKLIKNRSPRVVDKGRNPWRCKVGYRNSNNVITTSAIPIVTKNSAVGKVHAIQL
ncbi:MAG: hypothetical protein CM15mP120_19870 [Pseudomonadota bacterium]|nr:MAG: hypothetical protein CM15mP120_19870 [Pseudomonadota bacterium]